MRHKRSSLLQGFLTAHVTTLADIPQIVQPLIPGANGWPEYLKKIRIRRFIIIWYLVFYANVSKKHIERLNNNGIKAIMKKTVLPILLATIWISISEFVRNTFLLHNFWREHYQNLGLTFPEQPINGAVWGIWSLCFAIAIFIFGKKYTIIQTTFLSWFVGFVFMWLV